MSQEAEALVLTEIQPSLTPGVGIGRITINSPRTLNSLNLEIILTMREQLGAWEKDPKVGAVVIEGAGEKAFCAGGDVKRVRDLIRLAAEQKKSPLEVCQVFFENEYRLDYLIHTYAKPIVVWGDGIIMGGGIGVMNGASHRIVTETTMMAMPEITIGLYPDVGASKFLGEMPGRIGLFLGLTATRFHAGDALFVGMADYYLPRAGKNDLWAALRALPLDGNASNRDRVSHAIKALSAPPPASLLKARQAEIDALMEGATIQELAARFNSAEIAEDDGFLKAARASMSKGSPTSLAITFEQYRRCKNIDWKNAFQQEMILSLQCCLQADFEEGVRALLVDKDNAPAWNPKSLAEVTQERAIGHFRAPWADGVNPLHDL